MIVWKGWKRKGNKKKDGYLARKKKDLSFEGMNHNSFDLISFEFYFSLALEY
jgi:hypothetical protein